MNLFRAMICFVLIAAISLISTGCAPQAQKIDWNLYGHSLSPDGTVTETVEFTFSGTIIDYDSMKMAVTSFPDDPPYTLFDDADYYTAAKNAEQSPYYIFSFYYYDEDMHATLPGRGAMLLDEESVIFLLNDGTYLAASTAPEADPREILAFFNGFIEEYVIND